MRSANNGGISVRSAEMRNRLKNTGGFSLAEALLAVLILLLVSVIVASGIPVARDAYYKVVLAANAKTMLSTAVTALHDEIGTAWRIENVSDKSISYFSAGKGTKSLMDIDEEDGSITIKDYISLKDDLIHDVDKIKENDNKHELISGKGYTPQMYVTYTSIGYDKDQGVVTIGGLAVYKNNDSTTPLAEFVGADGAAKPFTIRVISGDYIETSP